VIMTRRIIALLTDFGTEDGYVGAMKGKILSIAPEANIVDISHEIMPFNIRQAAFCLTNCYAYFPEKTVFIVVVDPGVGTARKGLMIQTTNHFFIGPDNGVFSLIYEKEAFNSFEILVDTLPWEVAATFHGRDVFSPLGALLAADKSINRFLTATKRHTSFVRPIRKVKKKRFHIPVVHIDHFGNVILNFQRKDFSKMKTKKFGITVDDHKFGKIHNTFGEVSRGEFLLMWDSSDYLQIAKNGGSAAKDLGISTDSEVGLAL
jgi:S-adenosylmethionine hydrolase